MPTGNPSTHDNQGLRARLVCAFTVVIMTAVGAACGLTYRHFENSRATAEAEDNLTVLHGFEITRAIERFERTWYSLDAHKDPATQREVATARLIDYLGVERVIDPKAVSWYVHRSASVTAVRVLAYDALHFKAIACVTWESATVSKDGVVLESQPLQTHRRLYVFVRDGETWKADASFDLTRWDWAERAWRSETPEWEKQVIGELPREAKPDCSAAKTTP